MTAVALDARQAHQQRVTALLAELEERRSRIHRLKAGGALRAGLHGLKVELEETRRSLLDVIG